MKDAAKKLVDWSVGSVIGNVAWMAFASFIGWIVNERTGCISVVMKSMAGHEIELAGWTISFVLLGVLAGAVIRNRISIRQLKESDTKIEKLKRGIVGLEEVEGIIRYLPDDMSEQLAYIYAHGGSINAETCGVLQALVKSRLLIMDGITSGVPHWRIAPGAMKYLNEHPEFPKR